MTRRAAIAMMGAPGDLAATTVGRAASGTRSARLDVSGTGDLASTGANSAEASAGRQSRGGGGTTGRAAIAAVTTA